MQGKATEPGFRPGDALTASERRQKERIDRMLKRYITPKVVSSYEFRIPGQELPIDSQQSLRIHEIEKTLTRNPRSLCIRHNEKLYASAETAQAIRLKNRQTNQKMIGDYTVLETLVLKRAKKRCKYGKKKLDMLNLRVRLSEADFKSTHNALILP